MNGLDWRKDEMMNGLDWRKDEMMDGRAWLKDGTSGPGGIFEDPGPIHTLPAPGSREWTPEDQAMWEVAQGFAPWLGEDPLNLMPPDVEPPGSMDDWWAVGRMIGIPEEELAANLPPPGPDADPQTWPQVPGLPLLPVGSILESILDLLFPPGGPGGPQLPRFSEELLRFIKDQLFQKVPVPPEPLSPPPPEPIDIPGGAKPMPYEEWQKWMREMLEGHEVPGYKPPPGGPYQPGPAPQPSPIRWREILGTFLWPVLGGVLYEQMLQRVQQHPEDWTDWEDQWQALYPGVPVPPKPEFLERERQFSKEPEPEPSPPFPPLPRVRVRQTAAPAPPGPAEVRVCLSPAPAPAPAGPGEVRLRLS